MYIWKVPGSISTGTPVVLSEILVVYLCFYRQMLGWYLIYTLVASFKISISSLTDSNTDDTLVFIMYLLNLVFFQTGWIWMGLLYHLSKQQIQTTHTIIDQYSCYLFLNIRETNVLYRYILYVKR